MKLFLGSVVAMVFGLAAASPILVSNLALTKEIEIEVDVVYAYFAVQEFDGNVTGLWRNSTRQPWDPPRIVSYLIVLNVTNASDETALMGEFEASAAQGILVRDGTSEMGSLNYSGVEVNQSRPNVIVNQSTYPGDGFSVQKHNVVVTAFRDLSRYYPGWSQYWPPKTSRLIALTGMMEVPDLVYAVLESRRVYLYGEVRGKRYGGGSWSTGYSVKQVQLQMIENEFLYNALLNEDQVLRIDRNGIEVYVELRM